MSRIKGPWVLFIMIFDVCITYLWIMIAFYQKYYKSTRITLYLIKTLQNHFLFSYINYMKYTIRITKAIQNITLYMITFMMQYQVKMFKHYS